MKINVDVDIEPEELRRLVGLPDMQPLWDTVYKRLGDADTEFVQALAKTAFTEGMRTLDLSARVLKTLGGLATSRRSASSDEAAPPKQAAKAAASGRKRPATKAKRS